MSWRARFPGVSEAEWRDWRWQHRHALRTPEALAAAVDLTEHERRGLAATAAVLRLAHRPPPPVLPGEDASCPRRGGGVARRGRPARSAGGGPPPPGAGDRPQVPRPRPPPRDGHL